MRNTMKELFPGYFRENDTRLHVIWDEALFVFDANILLNLYRYSNETRDEFLRILENAKDRIWIPYQATATNIPRCERVLVKA